MDHGNHRTRMTLLWKEMDKAMVNHGESQILDAVMRLQLSEVSDNIGHISLAVSRNWIRTQRAPHE